MKMRGRSAAVLPLLLLWSAVVCCCVCSHPLMATAAKKADRSLFLSSSCWLFCLEICVPKQTAGSLYFETEKVNVVAFLWRILFLRQTARACTLEQCEASLCPDQPGFHDDAAGTCVCTTTDISCEQNSLRESGFMDGDAIFVTIDCEDSELVTADLPGRIQAWKDSLAALSTSQTLPLLVEDSEADCEVICFGTTFSQCGYDMGDDASDENTSWTMDQMEFVSRSACMECLTVRALQVALQTCKEESVNNRRALRRTVTASASLRGNRVGFTKQQAMAQGQNFSRYLQDFLRSFLDPTRCIPTPNRNNFENCNGASLEGCSNACRGLLEAKNNPCIAAPAGNVGDFVELGLGCNLCELSRLEQRKNVPCCPQDVCADGTCADDTKENSSFCCKQKDGSDGLCPLENGFGQCASDNGGCCPDQSIACESTCLPKPNRPDEKPPCCPEDLCSDGSCDGEKCQEGGCLDENGCCPNQTYCDFKKQCLSEGECCGNVCESNVCCRPPGQCGCGQCLLAEAKCCPDGTTVVNIAEECPCIEGQEKCNNGSCLVPPDRCCSDGTPSIPGTGGECPCGIPGGNYCIEGKICCKDNLGLGNCCNADEPCAEGRCGCASGGSQCGDSNCPRGSKCGDGKCLETELQYCCAPSGTRVGTRYACCHSYGCRRELAAQCESAYGSNACCESCLGPGYSCGAGPFSDSYERCIALTPCYGSTC